MIKVIRTYVITLIFTICILFGISQYQEVFAINYNGTEIDGAPDYNEHTLLVSDSNYYYLISHTDGDPRNVWNFNGSESTGYTITNVWDWYPKSAKKYDKTTKEYIESSGTLPTIPSINNIHATEYDITIGSTVIPANFNKIITIENNDKFQIKSTANTILKENFNVTLSNVANTFFLVTDAYGDFVEQREVSISNGTTVTLSCPPEDIRNYYFSFPGEYATTTITYNQFTYPWLSWSKYEPVFSIAGQAQVELLGASDATKQPYIKPRTATTILFRILQNGQYITRARAISANEQFTFASGDNVTMKFLHESGTNILVESNFALNTASTPITIIDQSVIDDLLAGGGTIVEDPNATDTVYVVNPYKALKITNIQTGLITTALDVYLTASANSNGEVSMYTYDESNTLVKVNEYKIDNTNSGKNFRITIPREHHAIITDTTGTIQVTIPKNLKEDTHFTAEVLTNYTPNSAAEQLYDTNNPTPINIGSANDMYVKQSGTTLWDSISGTVNGLTNTDLSTVSGMAGQVSSMMDIFTQPVKNLFTGVPELYGLIILGFGLALVKFVLGR